MAEHRDYKPEMTKHHLDYRKETAKLIDPDVYSVVATIDGTNLGEADRADLEFSIYNPETGGEQSLRCRDALVKRIGEQKIPDSLGECADMLMNIKNERAKLTKQDNELKSYANLLKSHVLDELKSHDLTSSSGHTGCVTVATKNRYSISNKEEFLKYVIETEGYDLITTAVTSAAINERVQDEVKVPGVGCFEQTVINLTKRKV